MQGPWSWGQGWVWSKRGGSGAEVSLESDCGCQVQVPSALRRILVPVWILVGCPGLGSMSRLLGVGSRTLERG